MKVTQFGVFMRYLRSYESMIFPVIFSDIRDGTVFKYKIHRVETGADVDCKLVIVGPFESNINRLSETIRRINIKFLTNRRTKTELQRVNGEPVPLTPLSLITKVSEYVRKKLK